MHHSSRTDHDTTGQVRFADRTVPLAAVRNDPARFARALARARAEIGHAECLCRTPPLRLVIRSRAGRHHLARWPGEGAQHAPGCGFHQADASLSGRSGYTAGALTETPDGTTIRLAAPLQLAGTRSPAAITAPTRTASGAARAMTLLGLLHWLWEQSQLNLWHPRWRRSWSTCHARLTQPAGDCTVNGQDLAARLYVVPPYRPGDTETNTAAFTAFTNRLYRVGRRQRRGLILGEIKDTRPTQYGTRFALRHHRGGLYASTALTDKARRSYRSAFSNAATSDPRLKARRIGLFLIERTRNYLTIADMAVMLTNRLWIPADSSYEIIMADRLIAAGRSFTKPIRYDTTDAVYPDFVLTDGPDAVYVEVYGVLGNADYDDRKRTKQDFYRDAGATVIEWDVTGPLPDLTPGRAAYQQLPYR